jgi:hypothetical protein
MKPRPHLQQATERPAQLGPALGRLGDAAEDLQQRRFAGPVTADDPNYLACLNVEGHVAQGPKRTGCGRPGAPTAQDSSGAAQGRLGGTRERLAERPVIPPLSLAQAVLLG